MESDDRHISRRALLAAGGVTSVVAALGAVTLISDSDRQSNESIKNQTQSSTPVESSTDSLWSLGQDVTVEAPVSRTARMPDFDYTPVDVQSEEAKVSRSVYRVQATPSDEKNGDRVILHVDADALDDITELLRILWTDGESFAEYETKVANQSIRFSIYDGPVTVAFGPLTYEKGEANKLLIARGKTLDDTQHLIDDFSRFYMNKSD